MLDRSLSHLAALRSNIHKLWDETWHPTTEADKLLEELGPEYVLNWFQTVSALPDGGIGIHGQSQRAEDPIVPHELWWQQIGHPKDELQKHLALRASLPDDDPEKKRFARFLLKKLENSIEYAAMTMSGQDGQSARVIIFKNPGVEGKLGHHFGINDIYFTWASRENACIPVENRILDLWQTPRSRRTSGGDSLDFSKRVLRTLIMMDLGN